MTAADTTVDAVLTALHAAVVANLGADVYVLDGPKVDWPVADAVVIGYGSPAVDHTLASRGISTLFNESYTVNCVAYSWSDEPDIGPRRTRCKELLAAVRTVLDKDSGGDPTLGGACTLAKFGTKLEWVQSAFKGGACEVGFQVHVEATI